MSDSPKIGKIVQISLGSEPYRPDSIFALDDNGLIWLTTWANEGSGVQGYHPWKQVIVPDQDSKK